MATPPLPTPLEQLGNRRFSFSPPIREIEHNEWLFGRVTWSDLMIVNARSGQEVWVPRRFVGEMSPMDDPIRIVGLIQELEYSEGFVRPHRRRVIELPVSGDAQSAGPRERRLAPVVAITLHSPADSRTGKIVVGAVVIGVLGYLVVANVWRTPNRHPARHSTPAVINR